MSNRKEYILIFDDFEQVETSVSSTDAVERLFHFLNIESQKHTNRNPKDNIQKIKYHNECKYTTISKSTAKSDLIAHDEICVCLHSQHQGPIAKAVAIDIDKHLLKTLYPTKSIPKKIIKYQNDVEYKMKEWKQTYIGPISILRRAEAQIFAFHFMKVVEQSQIPLSIIDKQCEFTDGTCAKFTDFLDPLIPTKSMVEKISNCLKIKPECLWLSLVEYYMGGKQAFKEEINQI